MKERERAVPALTLTLVPGFQKLRGRKSTRWPSWRLRSLIQAQAPVTPGLAVTFSRRYTSARSDLGIGRLKGTDIGRPTPMRWPSVTFAVQLCWFGMTGDHGEAQDVVQEAFVRAWDRRASFLAEEAPEAWIRSRCGWR